MKLRLQPIRVYCLHHVTEVFDEETMHACDWMSADECKRKIQELREANVEFITIQEAQRHLKDDTIRTKKYAVITFDDGWASLKEIVPWFVSQQIPILLFLNPAYILGEERREMGNSLTQEELDNLLKKSNGHIQIASHGWNHTLCTELNKSDFKSNVDKCEAYLKKYSEYIPFFAYPCGQYAKIYNDYLQVKHITSVYMDGKMNYNNENVIHRENL